MGTTPHSELALSLDSNAAAIFRDLKIAIEYLPLTQVKPYERQLRRHSAAQVKSICDAITALGFVDPIQIGKDGTIIAGEARYLAAKRLGLTQVPVVRLDHLSGAEQKALRIALNRIGENSGWNAEALAFEFGDLALMDQKFEIAFDLEVTGFGSGEIDTLVRSAVNGEPMDDDGPIAGARNTTTVDGDIWVAGNHRLLCGAVNQSQALQLLLDGELAESVIAGSAMGQSMPHIRSQTSVANGPGDANSALIAQMMALAGGFAKPGAYQFWFAQWQQMHQVLDAGEISQLVLSDVCVWKKPDGSVNDLYQSTYELVFAFAPNAPANTTPRRKRGSPRPNVWDYSAPDMLGTNPHLKTQTIAMLADLMGDTSKRLGVVLDLSAHPAETLIAAEKSARRAHVVATDPQAIDMAVRSWQKATKHAAILLGTGETFEQTSARRFAAKTSVPSLAMAQPTVTIRRRRLNR